MLRGERGAMPELYARLLQQPNTPWTPAASLLADGNADSLAQAAAIAALNDAAYLKKSAEVNAQGYQQLTSAFDSMNIEYLPSSGNFVLFRAGQDDGAGARVNLALLKKGIIVRPVGNYGLPQWLRVSIGLPEENTAFLTALQSILA